MEPMKRRAGVALLLSTAVALVVGNIGLAGADPVETDEVIVTEDGVVIIEGEHVTITQEVDDPQPDVACAGRDSIRMDRDWDETSFTVIVMVDAPLCRPVVAKAATYLMPLGGGWPQELAEAVEFTLWEAGETVIVFEYFCAPVQFDVIEGDTPQTISPVGPHHGPLLFPPTNILLGTGGSARQYPWVYEWCEEEPADEPDPSTTTTTTTTSPTTSTTGPPPNVQGSTTTLPTGSQTATVEGSSATAEAALAFAG